MKKEQQYAKKTSVPTRIVPAVTLLLALLLVFCGALISCGTLQRDIHISSFDDSAKIDLAEIEETIVALESAPQRNIIADIRTKIANLSDIPDAEFQAQLAAWSGRLFLLEGRPSEAQRELRKSQTLSPENWPSVILASRLEQNVVRRQALLEEALMQLELPEGRGELQLELGRVLMEQNRFQEAVAAFDLAFTLLEDKPFYRENYLATRDRAWQLRNINEDTGSRTLEIVRQDGLSWRDLIEITRTETDFFRFLTAGRDWSADEIFRRLLERFFIPVTQDITLMEWPSTQPRPDEIVLRSGTAWFLWHLYAENRAMRSLLSRYSTRYANMPNARSPVADLPLNSPFFDSILGCVESEFMSLPDGRNFVPNEKMQGSTYLVMLRKLGNQ
jgi:tetratricopeptide (TPR) repeat protein